MAPFPGPTTPQPDLAATLLGYLDYFREVVASTVSELDEDAVRRSILPSGWSPLELAYHLAHVERRWLDWGFEGLDVRDPWADSVDDRWHVPDDRSREDVVQLLRSRAPRAREVVESHALDERGAPGERWDGAPPATLERVLLHLVQEYARHCGHLDIVRELSDGVTGE